jgi:hypothetical protein
MLTLEEGLLDIVNNSRKSLFSNSYSKLEAKITSKENNSAWITK